MSNSTLKEGYVVVDENDLDISANGKMTFSIAVNPIILSDPENFFNEEESINYLLENLRAKVYKIIQCGTNKYEIQEELRKTYILASKNNTDNPNLEYKGQKFEMIMEEEKKEDALVTLESLNSEMGTGHVCVFEVLKKNDLKNGKSEFVIVKLMEEADTK